MEGAGTYYIRAGAVQCHWVGCYGFVRGKVHVRVCFGCARVGDFSAMVSGYFIVLSFWKSVTMQVELTRFIRRSFGSVVTGQKRITETEHALTKK